MLDLLHLITTTIIGWNVPNGTGLNAGIIPFAIILVVMVMFGGLPLMLGQSGETVALWLFIGMLVGSVLGMLSINASSANIVPVALPIVAGLYLVMYLWKGR